MTAKQALLDMAQSVPDDIDWEEAHYQLFLRQGIEDCKVAKVAGKVYTLEEARGRGPVGMDEADQAWCQAAAAVRRGGRDPPGRSGL